MIEIDDINFIPNTTNNVNNNQTYENYILPYL